jgi:glycosyltransferase involved in cell wall biosynthesis
MFLPQSAAFRAVDPIAAQVRRTLRVGFLSPHNPHDATAFSGTAHHMAKALSREEGLEVAIIGNHRPLGAADRLFRRLRRHAGFSFDPREAEGLDIVLGLSATAELARLSERSDVPYVHATDATPVFLRDVYGWNVPREADLREARVVRRAALTLYSSQYMATRAVAELGAEAGRIAAVPFGANLNPLPEAMPDKPPQDPLRLLWVGSSWERKGGAMALAAFEGLRWAGRAVRLDLAGEVPRNLRLPPGATRAGYLDKTRPLEAARLSLLFSEAHLFVLPTRADCTPMVIAEANAHGTPVLVTDTGGVGALVEGRNGRMLPSGADPADWAAAIDEMTADRAAYAALSRSSFEHAVNTLCWDAWARQATTLLRTAVA